MLTTFFRIDDKTPEELKALTEYPLQQDSDKAYPHFDVTSGFIVAINPDEEDVQNGVIIPCAKNGRWYFKGGDNADFGCAVAWHESEDDASQPHTEGAYSVSRHISGIDGKYSGNDTYVKMIDTYTKQKCLISQIVGKGNLPSHLCGYIIQFVVYHPDDKRYFTKGCTDDRWYRHTGHISNLPINYCFYFSCGGFFDAKKFRDYSKLPVEKLMSVLKFESRKKKKVSEDLWRETVRNASTHFGGPVSLPNGMCFNCDQGAASIEVRYNNDQQCLCLCVCGPVSLPNGMCFDSNHCAAFY